MSFYRRTGHREVIEIGSGTTLSIGDLVQYDESGEAIVAVTAKGVLGICLKAATSSTNTEVDILHPGDIVECTSVTGTMATTEIGNEADISSATALTLTESNGDALITGWDGATTSKLYCTFKNLAHGSPGAGVETT